MNLTTAQTAALAVIALAVVLIPAVASVAVLLIRQMGIVRKVWVETMRQSTVLETTIVPQLNEAHDAAIAAHDSILTAVEKINGGSSGTGTN